MDENPYQSPKANPAEKPPSTTYWPMEAKAAIAVSLLMVAGGVAGLLFYLLQPTSP